MGFIQVKEHSEPWFTAASASGWAPNIVHELAARDPSEDGGSQHGLKNVQQTSLESLTMGVGQVRLLSTRPISARPPTEASLETALGRSTGSEHAASAVSRRRRAGPMARWASPRGLYGSSKNRRPAGLCSYFRTHPMQSARMTRSRAWPMPVWSRTTRY